MALYMGPSGGNSPFWGGQPPQNPNGPFTPAGPVPPPNVLAPDAVRATGPSQGFDAAYLQNLASSIGNLFARPQGNLSFNPLGNLSDISSPSSMGGTTPSPGLPLTMLQNALNGLGFSYTPSAPPTPTPDFSRWIPREQESFRMMQPQGPNGY
jgi:hypothetical protein